MGDTSPAEACLLREVSGRFLYRSIPPSRVAPYAAPCATTNAIFSNRETPRVTHARGARLFVCFLVCDALPFSLILVLFWGTGKMNITTTDETTEWRGYNPYKRKYETLSKSYRSSMITSWNKFCFTGESSISSFLFFSGGEGLTPLEPHNPRQYQFQMSFSKRVSGCEGVEDWYDMTAANVKVIWYTTVELKVHFRICSH